MLKNLLISFCLCAGFVQAEQPFVFVNSSGKCGGSTLLKSFQHLGLQGTHRHILDEEQLSLIEKVSKERPILFVDSIRDPIARKISSYFQNLVTHINNYDVYDILAKYTVDRWGFVDNLIKDFTTKIHIIDESYCFWGWDQFGYHVLSEPFDFERHYQIHQEGNFYFLSLRFEDIQNWKTIIRSLPLPFDFSKFEILPDNISAGKYYAYIYKDFLSRFTMSQRDFDEIMIRHAPQLEHFYTEEERQGFVEKWKPSIR